LHESGDKKMRRIFCVTLIAILSGSLAAQTKNTSNRNASRTVFEGQPASIRLAPRVTTTIRLPEPVNSVVLGDSNLFQAEYSPSEPLLVFARTTGSGTAQTNLVISTVLGRQFILLLRSLGAAADPSEPGVDLLVSCRAAQVRFIEEAFPSALIAETVSVGGAAHLPSTSNETISPSESQIVRLDEILNRQHDQKIQKLYGDRIRVGIGRVTEDGSRLIVSFSVIGSGSEPAELVPPQVQLSGQTKSGIFRRARWTTVQQLPVETYQMSQRRLDPGGRIDGVVVFERPRIKQSTEKLMLQIADSAAVDQPTLAPISFRQTTPLEKDHE
jgi:hypothetical protein